MHVSRDLIRPMIASTVRRAILERLLVHPDQSVSVQGLSEELGFEAAATQRELVRLQKAGLLQVSGQNGDASYLVNQASPVFAELKETLAAPAYPASAPSAAPVNEPPALDHPVFVPSQEERAREAARKPRHWTEMTAEALLWIVLMVYGATGVVWYLNHVTSHI